MQYKPGFLRSGNIGIFHHNFILGNLYRARVDILSAIHTFMAVLEIPLQNIFFTVKNVLVVSFIYDQQAAFPYEFPEFSERFQLA